MSLSPDLQTFLNGIDALVVDTDLEYAECVSVLYQDPRGGIMMMAAELREPNEHGRFRLAPHIAPSLTQAASSVEELRALHEEMWEAVRSGMSHIPVLAWSEEERVMCEAQVVTFPDDRLRYTLVQCDRLVADKEFRQGVMDDPSRPPDMDETAMLASNERVRNTTIAEMQRRRRALN